MPNGRIAGNRFHYMLGSWCRSADQSPFNPAMLKSERYFQVEYLFAMTLKTKMPRFYNAGVDRADRHLMNFIPFDTVKIHYGRQQAAAIAPAPESFSVAERLLETNRLEPGVPFRAHQTLFRYLAFKQVQLWTEYGK